MGTEQMLPPDLIWEPDGHLTEVALTMIADGEHALLGVIAMDHVAGCAACSDRLGASALLALRVGEELLAFAAREPSRAAVGEAAREPLPAIPARAAFDPLNAIPPRAAFDPLNAIPARAAFDPLNAIPVEALPARKSPTPPRAVVAPRPLPIRAIVAALAVAAVGALPSILAGTARLPEMVTIVVRAVSITTRAAMEIALGSAAGSFGVAPLLSWLSAGLFVMVGLGVARAMSRRRALQGGM